MRLIPFVLGLLFFVVTRGALAAPPGTSTSDLITQGIGQRYSRTPGPLGFTNWPVPLHHIVAATMASALSPDGRLLVTGGGYNANGGRLIIRDLETKSTILTRQTDRGLRRIRFVPNTDWIVVAGYDGKARLMDARTGRHIREFSRHTANIDGVAVSVDGSRMATASHDGLVMLWNLQTGQHLRTFTGHTNDVMTVAFVPTEPLLVSGSRDLRVLIWNIETGELVREFTGPESQVEDVAVSPGGTVIAAACGDQKTWLWDRETGKLLGTLPARRGRLSCVDFSPDGNHLAMGGFDGEVTLWDYAQQSMVVRIPAHQSAVFAVTFSGDGQLLASHGWSGDAKLWKSDGSLVTEFPIASDAQRAVSAAAWAPDESCFAVMDLAGGIRLISPDQNQELANFRIEGPQVSSLGFTGDGQLMTGHIDGSIRTVTRTGEASEPIAGGPPNRAGVARFSTVGPHAIAVQFLDGSAARIDVGQSKFVRLGETFDFVQVATDPGLDWFATLHHPGFVRFWDAATGKPLAGQLNLQEQSPQKLAVTSVGSRLICSNATGLINCRVTRTGDEVSGEPGRFLPVANGPLQALAISPDGQTVVGPLLDGTIRVHGIDGSMGTTIKRDNTAGPATEVMFGPRSQRLITIHQNGQGWFWDIDRANAEVLPLISIAAHEKGTRFVSFALDDQALVTNGYDGKGWVWDLATGERRQLIGKDSVSTCAVSPDTRKVAIGHFPAGLDLRDLQSLETERTFEKPKRGPYSIQFSPDQRRLITSYYEKDLILYDLAGETPPVALGPAALPWTYAVFSPDSKMFAACTGDYKQQSIVGSITLHDAATGNVLKKFEGFSGEAKFAAFDPEGRRLATSASDKVVRVYDIGSGEELAALKQSDTAFSIVFVPGTDLLITGDYRGNLRIWDFQSKTLVQSLRAHPDLLQRLDLSRDKSALVTGGKDGSVKLWKLVGEGNQLRVF
ncbi:WD domain, G-beta repeat [Caulifigura coniformis]|uniref:WD domain, G-beta repeat n=1 Tax=Caulifigura coniformis TaxID=2527983 RepID=A0A517SLS0_9PLAN|nr:WD40 repeat domain-containing protein [Caulifigura coniformis]QDT57069.1 WD domain, G-beta repeat [Caulifigura coniformis]